MKTDGSLFIRVVIQFGLSLPFMSLASAQFAPPAGQLGSTAIHRDSSALVAWASTCEVVRGPMNIADPELGPASAGLPEMAVGQTMGVVSLGDGGIATFTFARPIANSEGFDLAVFENGFSDNFLEMAFVEVSSDGNQFFRFPAISLTQSETQVSGFGSIDATQVHNLAGKYRAMFGTPFDLQDLVGTEGLDVGRVTHVRIVDVIGSIASDYATYDSEGNAVNDPWPTPFESSGFDLDAVGVIHEVEDNVSVATPSEGHSISIYPNPANDRLHVHHNEVASAVRMLDLRGALVANYASTSMLDVSFLPSGTYLVQVISADRVHTQRICINH